MNKNLKETTEKQVITLSHDMIGQRIDAAIASILVELPRTKIQSLIKKGKIYRFDNHKPFKSASYRIKSCYDIVVEIEDEQDLTLEKDQDIALDIIYEDQDLIVINKQAGLVVHPGAGRKDGTLVNALLHHTQGQLSNLSGDDRPGILHRLDKNTTGLMVIAKNNDTHLALSNQIKSRDMKRTYQAILWGTPSPRNGTIETLIGRDQNNRTKMAVLEDQGKTAITHYTVLQVLGLHNSLVECHLETGRTHQIRVHMMHLGFTVLGDPTYSFKHIPTLRLLTNKSQSIIKNMKRQALHAYKLSFLHPRSNERVFFECSLPKDMQEIIDALKEK